MPRMQVYLPSDLYQQVKERGLRASELLQAAVSAEVRRLELEARMDEYMDALVDEVGAPSQAQLEHAEAIVRRLQDRAEPVWAG